jgi:hypothetical protein
MPVSDFLEDLVSHLSVLHLLQQVAKSERHDIAAESFEIRRKNNR